MSRRAAIVEEFDDDTDLPLPLDPLPNTGIRGPLLEQLSYSDQSDDDDEADNQYNHNRPGPASPPRRAVASAGKEITIDSSVYKTWTCIYPIYLDAKRPYGTGQRRVERAKGLWWPLSKDIADAANRLGLATIHEVSKSHPRDWENPGRVRVQWKKDGRLVNPMIKNKKQLLENICFQIQILKPENVPKPPYSLSPSNNNKETLPSSVQPTANTTSSGKGKQSTVITKTKAPAPTTPTSKTGRRLPVPPEPFPPLNSRVSPYSPAISSGILIEAVTASMNAAAEAPGLPGAGPGAANPPNMQKGKRKVVRVRG